MNTALSHIDWESVKYLPETNENQPAIHMDVLDTMGHVFWILWTH